MNNYANLNMLVISYQHTLNWVWQEGGGGFSDTQRGGRGWGQCPAPEGGQGRGSSRLQGGGQDWGSSGIIFFCHDFFNFEKSYQIVQSLL